MRGGGARRGAAGGRHAKERSCFMAEKIRVLGTVSMAPNCPVSLMARTETCSTLVSLRSLRAESHEANGAPDEASAAEPAQSGTLGQRYLSDEVTKWSSCRLRPPRSIVSSGTKCNCITDISL